MVIQSISELQDHLAQYEYLADRTLATTVYLGLKLNKPILLEGEAGVGKTEVAKALAEVLATDLIRLQCYEGLDINHAVYEWNYPRQMLYIRMHDAGQGNRAPDSFTDIFGTDFLIKRPLLQAIENARERPPVLLIDEIDRSYS